MTSVITWYDVLGVLPDATPDDIREAWQMRGAALQPGMLAGPAGCAIGRGPGDAGGGAGLARPGRPRRPGIV